MARFLGFHIPGTARVSPNKEAGVSGTPIHGGWIDSGETNPKLSNANRYKTAANILTNISVVAASVRYFLNLLANPKWTVTPADDTAEAEAMAEFVEEVIGDLHTSWTRIVRRTGLYRFHGFSVQEWTAKKREDGTIRLVDIESRPQHTIERMEVDENGKVIG